MKSKYDPHKHHRRSIRLSGYDYSQAGAYFVTICTRHRACLFGCIENEAMVLNDAGQMIQREWLALAQRFPHIAYGAHVVMPNHFHAILNIIHVEASPNTPNDVRASLVDAPDTLVDAPDTPTATPDTQKNNARASLVDAQNIITAAPTTHPSLGDMIGAFKSITTNEYIKGVKHSGWPPFDGKLWHRNYHEHIIRNQTAYIKISGYIHSNPARWKDDTYFK